MTTANELIEQKIKVRKALAEIASLTMKICDIAQSVEMPRTKFNQAVNKFIEAFYIE